MKCQTCIHRYVCKNLFVYSQIDFERCINYRLDESTVSKRRFAKVGKTHHIAEVGKKVKSVYPVKSKRLCVKCEFLYSNTCKNETGCSNCKNFDSYFGACNCAKTVLGEPCKYFRRSDAELK